MKTKLRFAAVFALAAFAFNTSVNAQCTPDPQYAGEPFGLWPDSISNLPTAYANNSTGYNTNIDLVTLTDTVLTATISGNTQSQIRAIIQRLRIHDVNGQPTGFSYAPNYSGTNGWINTGSNPNYSSVQGCVNISAPQGAVQAALTGGPNNDGIYPLDVIVDVYITEATCLTNCLSGVVQAVLNSSIVNKWLSETSFGSLMPNIDRYIIKTEAFQSVNIIESVDLANAFPNPVRDIATIEFNSKNASEIQFRLYDMIGKEVYFENINSTVGMNSFKFNASNLPAGTYVYTINDGVSMAKSKIVVAAK
jgi:hypothetical protein